ncbi:MAG TPA: type II toxin-antitoxin system HicA family toxin [Thermodesulfobacteriota bacterium]|nr:type II toxin-antitoxin system HicA family toxin [Thermodesulfobacteriota bacterium]
MIFEDPVRSDILWSDIENLLYALGAEIGEGKGSRVRIALRDVRAVFHRPHPRRVTDKGSVKSMRRLLIAAGVKDVEI